MILCRAILSRILPGNGAIGAIVFAALMAGEVAWAQSSSGRRSPPPPNAQQRLRAAQRAYDQTGAQIKAAVRNLRAAKDRLFEVRRRYDQVAEESRKVVVNHPTLLEAGRALADARSEAEAKRDAALRDLKRERDYRDESIELRRINRRMDELHAARLRSRLKSYPLDPQVDVEMRVLAQRAMELEDSVSDREAEVLEEDKAYQEAEVAVEQALAEAVSTTQEVVELAQGGAGLHAALRDLQAANNEFKNAANALASARARQKAALKTLVAAYAAVK